MKQLLIAAVARSSQYQSGEGRGMKITTFFIGLVVSTIFFIASSLMSIFFLFFVISIFAMLTTGSIFQGISIAWGNAPTYGVVMGGILGFGFFLISFVFPVLFEKQISEKRSSYENLKDSLGFGGANEYPGKNFIIMANESMTKAMVLWNSKFSDTPDYTILTEENIVESLVYIDDMTVSSVKSGTAGSLAGAAIGGVLTGGVGAVIGAIAGKRSKSESEVRVYRIGIRLTLKDTARPHADMIFHKPAGKEDKGLKKSDWLLSHYVESANHWQAVIKNIIANSEETKPLDKDSV
ncbi:MAG: hypothetical protein ACQEUG_15720 [Pseudomonadota bacterium]